MVVSKCGHLRRSGVSAREFRASDASEVEVCVCVCAHVRAPWDCRTLKVGERNDTILSRAFVLGCVLSRQDV